MRRAVSALRFVWLATAGSLHQGALDLTIDVANPTTSGRNPRGIVLNGDGAGAGAAGGSPPGSKDSGRRCDLEAGMAKLLAARVAWAAADNAVQVHGGNGFALEFRVSRILCDARILNIFEGAAEIQAQVIARRLLDGTN